MLGILRNESALVGVTSAVSIMPCSSAVVAILTVQGDPVDRVYSFIASTATAIGPIVAIRQGLRGSSESREREGCGGC